MSQTIPTIDVAENNRKVKIRAQVKDSLHGSMLSDRLNALPYLKVYDRLYSNGIVTIQAHTIIKEYTIERLFSDLENMMDLIIMPDESLPHTTA